MSITASNFEMLLIVAVVLCIFLAKKKPASKTKKIVNSVICVVLVGVIIAVNIATNIYASSLDSVFTKPASGSDSVTTTEEDWSGLVTEIADEGMVLLKNENNTLPLAEGIFGYGCCSSGPWRR
jgi:beta-glucosidase